MEVCAPISINAGQNSADLADSLIHLIENDMTKITDVNIIASYDPVLTNKQEHIITAK